MSVSVIFPMAGQGARFGYRFKPFLELNGRTFIEAAFESFRPFLSQIARVYFVFLQEQEEGHQVSQRLAMMFAGVNFKTVVLEKPTVGPAETLYSCLEREDVRGQVMVCDCDHALDVSGLMQVAKNEPMVQCALPTWDLTDEPLTAWSVAAVDSNQRVTEIAEKQLPLHGSVFRGVIGCYYFADAEQTLRRVSGNKQTFLSDLVSGMIEQGLLVRSVPVTQATFFGDPIRLEKASQRIA